MKIQSILFVFIVISVISCKMDNKATTPSAKAEMMSQKVGDAYAMLNQEDFKPGEIKADRAAALEALNFRMKESGNKAYTIMDKDIWVYDGVVKSSDMVTGDSLGGRWIDFKEDLTYEYGRFDQKEGKGKYFYDMEKAFLLLLDDNEGIKPQEFEVKMNNDMLVIVGHYTYKDNNMQAKLLRQASYPVKK
jgi:archaellum component FlaG (FlaF/FlaG flagellin family)